MEISLGITWVAYNFFFLIFLTRFVQLITLAWFLGKLKNFTSNSKILQREQESFPTTVKTAIQRFVCQNSFRKKEMSDLWVGVNGFDNHGRSF